MEGAEWSLYNPLLKAAIEGNHAEFCGLITGTLSEIQIASAAFIAVSKNIPDGLDKCLEYGFNPWARYHFDGVFEGPLMFYVCIRDRVECLQYIHRRGFDLIRYNDGRTVLQEAILHSSTQCVFWLINVARIPLSAPITNPPLEFIIEHAHISTTEKSPGCVYVKLLLSHGDRLLCPISRITNYMKKQTGCNEELTLELIKCHSCITTPEMLFWSMVNYHLTLISYITDVDDVRTITIPKSDQVPWKRGKVGKFRWNTSLVYIVWRYHISKIITTFHLSKECRRGLEIEKTALIRRREAVAMSTHKRLGADSPIQQCLDENLMEKIIQLSLQQEILTLN